MSTKETTYRVATIVGTRPEIIRLSRLISTLDSQFNHALVHTGQNDHPQLSDVFFSELEVRKPDWYLGIDNSSLGAQLGDLFPLIESFFLDFRPHAVVILGDTNSSMAAILARRMNIVVYHLEAGNRSFDNNVPEELNRRIVDHVSHFNLPYSERARENLIREGIHPRTICLSGSPLKEVIDHYRESIDGSDVLAKLQLESRGYLVASIHRQENVNHAPTLSRIITSLISLGDEHSKPVLLSVHPRTKKRVEELGIALDRDHLIAHEPFGYFDYMKLQEESYCVISDSGTISEESSLGQFPAVTLRGSMERPEALDSGSIVMAGNNQSELSQAVKLVTSRKEFPNPPNEYLVSNFSERVTFFICSTLSEASRWFGIRET